MLTCIYLPRAFLQILAFTRHMAALLPSAYTTATEAAEWTRLSWVPDPGTRYANKCSAAAHLVAQSSALPPMQLVSASSLIT